MLIPHETMNSLRCFKIYRENCYVRWKTVLCKYVVMHFSVQYTFIFYVVIMQK